MRACASTSPSLCTARGARPKRCASSTTCAAAWSTASGSTRACGSAAWRPRSSTTIRRSRRRSPRRPTAAPRRPGPSPPRRRTRRRASRSPATSTPATPDRGGRHFHGVVSSRLVGRGPEQATLARALDAAAQNLTQWVILQGEPGIGKTRLLEQLAEDATTRGFDVFWGRSYESGAAPAFWTWMGTINGLTDVSEQLPDAYREAIDQLKWSSGPRGRIDQADAGRYLRLRGARPVDRPSSPPRSADDRPRRPAVGRPVVARAHRVPRRLRHRLAGDLRVHRPRAGDGAQRRRGARAGRPRPPSDQSPAAPRRSAARRHARPGEGGDRRAGLGRRRRAPSTAAATATRSS